MIYLILGRREQGKTTLARYLMAPRRPRVVIDPRKLLIQRADQVSPDVLDVLDRLDEGRDAYMTPIDLQADVDELGREFRKWTAERPDDQEYCVVFDEAGLYSVDQFDYLFRTAKRSQTTFLLTAHRPQDIKTSVRAVADFWVMFRMTQPHDLKAIEERCGSAVAEDVSRLERHHFILWDDAIGEAKIHRRPDLWRDPPAVGVRSDLELEPVRRSLLD